jgi:hypothetical protein
VTLATDPHVSPSARHILMLVVGHLAVPAAFTAVMLGRVAPAAAALLTVLGVVLATIGMRRYRAAPRGASDPVADGSAQPPLP